MKGVSATRAVTALERHLESSENPADQAVIQSVICLNADNKSVKRQEMIETKEKLHQISQARMEFTVAFEAIGMNFTELNPIVHNALLKEASATSTAKAMANFIEAWNAIERSGASDEGKINVLREVYGYRAKQFSD